MTYKYNVVVTLGNRSMVMGHADKRHMLLAYERECMLHGCMHVGLKINGVDINPTDDDTFVMASVDAAEDGKVWDERLHEFANPDDIARLELEGFDEEVFIDWVWLDIEGCNPVTGEDGEAIIRGEHAPELVNILIREGFDAHQRADDVWVITGEPNGFFPPVDDDDDVIDEADVDEITESEAWLFYRVLQTPADMVAEEESLQYYMESFFWDDDDVEYVGFGKNRRTFNEHERSFNARKPESHGRKNKRRTIENRSCRRTLRIVLNTYEPVE